MMDLQKIGVIAMRLPKNQREALMGEARDLRQHQLWLGELSQKGKIAKETLDNLEQGLAQDEQRLFQKARDLAYPPLAKAPETPPQATSTRAGRLHNRMTNKSEKVKCQLSLPIQRALATS